MKRQAELCHVSRTRVYRKKELRQESPENLEYMKAIDKMHTEEPSWGSRRMCEQFKRQGYQVNRKRIQRLMRKMDLEAVFRGPNLSKRLHAQYVRPYLLRNLNITHEDQVWGIDISYIPMKLGFMYLFIIIDWYTRQIVDYELSYSLEKGFVLRCLARALKHRKPEIINSDQGSHFTSPAYLKLVEEAGIRVSMDGRGQALDNIITERFFRTIKYEEIYINEYPTPKLLSQAIQRFIRKYNETRPHQSLGYRAPNEVSKRRPTYEAA